MRVHVVSDVHGNVEALARAGDGADALVVLGDLVEFVDYHDPAAGILGRVFGPADERGVRAAARRRRARASWAGSSATPGPGVPEPPRSSSRPSASSTTGLFAALTAPTYAIPGNVDMPRLWPEYARPGLCLADGRVVDDRRAARSGSSAGCRCRRARTPRRGGPWTPARAGGRGLRRRRRAAAGRSTCCAATPRPPCPSWPTTWSPGGPRRPRRRCWRGSAATGRGRRCSGTCTSRWPRGCGSVAPSASTSGTSGRPAAPYVLRW